MSLAPRVYLAGNFLSPLGLARAPIEDLADKLRERGFEVTAASPYRNRFLRTAHLLWTAVLRRNRYDLAVVDVYSGPAFLIAESLALILRMIGRPYIACLHGGGLPDFAQTRGKRVATLLTGAAKVTAPSAYLVRAMRSWRDDIEELPNPLALSAYAPRLRSQARPRLIWLRTFRGIYNPVLAIEAFARLKASFPGARLTMIGKDWGDGTLDETRRAAVERGVEESVEILGSVPKSKVPEVLGGGDIFLNTTDFDNTPVTVIEAMACGLCVVSTDVGGMRDLIEDGRDGLLVPPRNPERMAAAINRVLTDSELAGRLSATARRKAESYDWSHALPRWTALLEEAAGGRPAAYDPHWKESKTERSAL